MSCKYCDDKIERIKLKRQWVHYINRKIFVCTQENHLTYKPKVDILKKIIMPHLHNGSAPVLHTGCGGPIPSWGTNQAGSKL